MRAVLRKAAVLSLSFALGCGALAGCGNSAAKIDGSQVLMTVNGEDVRLGVGSFYAKYEQASIYQIYSMYFGQTTGIFDSAHDHDGGQETYGDEMKESVISDLKKMMTIKQHADEYGVSLTDEQKKAIDEAAQAYIDGNDESVRAKIGADKEDVVTLMTLQTLQAAMMDPIVKDVDTEISDEEAQQTSLTYVKVDVQSEAESAESAAESSAAESAGSAAESAAAESTASTSESAAAESTASAAESVAAESTASTSESAAAESTASAAESAAAESSESAAESSSAESAESAAESAAAESTESAAESAAESTESTEGSAEETAAQTEAREAAEAIIAEAMLEEDIASADLDAIAKTVDENYYTQTGHFTKAAPESATLDANLVEAVKDLEDGQLVDHAVQSADGTAYYVARLDHVVDEDATESEKSSILTSRKQTLYDDTVNGWVDEAQITVNDTAWAKVTLTDSDPVTLKTPPVESTASEAESTASSGTESASESAASAAESAVSGAESAAESAVSTAVSAAESAVSGAESAAVSTAESAVSTAVSAAESAVSTAVSAAESTVSDAESAANTAASTAKPAAGTAASTAVSAAESAASSVKSAS